MAVREFVAPLEPSGSLDAGRALILEEDALTLGIRLHGRIQKRLLQEDPAHQTERTVQGALARPGFTCLVRGRVDALLDGDPPVVEEIKTTFRPAAVLQALGEEAEHPFALQARMYAWLLWRETGVAPRCRLRVVGLVDEDETLVELPFDPEAFSRWVEERLHALQTAFLKALARAAERRALGAELAFPFPEPRPGQVELVSRVEDALRARQRLLLQAPTGLGKTAAILFPALRLALEDNLQVFYGTPRNSQHEVAEDCIRRMRPGVRSVTIRAKERVCPQPEVNCRPDVCPRAKLYFDRLKESGALETVAALGCATSAAIARVADAHQLCPFELALDAARHADVVIGDYNYAFSPNATLQRLFGTPEAAARMLVLVDEAHNLPSRAADWFSPCLEVAWLEDLKRQKHHPPNRALRTRVTAQLKRCLQLLQSFEGPHRTVVLEPQTFFVEEHRIGRLLTAAAAAGQELPPSHPLLELHHGWSAFCEVLRVLGEEHGLTWQSPGRLQITCADASEHLAQRMEAVAGAVLFSGTLKPFECHRRLSGLGSLETAAAEVRSPFPDAHRLVLVVPQISTLYRLRDREVPRIAHFLQRVLPLRRGNYFVFFSSFDMLEKTLPHLDLPGFRILAQPRRATQEQLQELLAALRTGQGVVVLAVQGGSLSEGIDCPGEALIGCVVVGPPLPRFDLEREHVRQHFQRKYGQGHQYAYTFPAAAKAVQAAGRVIRTPQDKGLLIFMDGRFLEDDYASCFPEGWFRASPRELVSEAILGDVRAFWER
jgi:DNA excision repair protein ERCC-2